MLHKFTDHPIDTIIFDLGGVLVDWDPMYLYKQLFVSEEAARHFLAKVCTNSWNEEQDGGRSLVSATELLVHVFPQYKSEIEAFYGRWTEMLGGPIQETVEILRQLKKRKEVKLYALTNWSAETWPIAWERYEFLHWFDGVLVSGQEHLKKPDLKIYDLICNRYQIDKSKALFIDDNLRNISAAETFGLHGIHYTSSAALANELHSFL